VIGKGKEGEEGEGEWSRVGSEEDERKIGWKDDGINGEERR